MIFLIKISSLESGRHNPGGPKTQTIKRLYVTGGLNMDLFGKAVVAYKTIDKDITLKNMNDVTLSSWLLTSF